MTEALKTQFPLPSSARTIVNIHVHQPQARHAAAPLSTHRSLDRRRRSRRRRADEHAPPVLHARHRDPLPGIPGDGSALARGTTPLPIAPATNFGDTFVIDDPLTEGPDAASPAVGRAQGFYMFASRTELALLLSVNMVFTAGPRINGSTVAVLARDLIPADVQELPVIGGTGAFCGVTGYGLLSTHFHNASSRNAVLRIDMYLSV
ncbi:unnamed protein product [Urochloa humidicola]